MEVVYYMHNLEENFLRVLVFHIIISHRLRTLLLYSKLGFLCIFTFHFFLFAQQPNQISLEENILVSRYINNPLLIDGEL